MWVGQVPKPSQLSVLEPSETNLTQDRHAIRQFVTAINDQLSGRYRAHYLSIQPSVGDFQVTREDERDMDHALFEVKRGHARFKGKRLVQCAVRRKSMSGGNGLVFNPMAPVDFYALGFDERSSGPDHAAWFILPRDSVPGAWFAPKSGEGWVDCPLRESFVKLHTITQRDVDSNLSNRIVEILDQYKRLCASKLRIDNFDDLNTSDLQDVVEDEALQVKESTSMLPKEDDDADAGDLQSDRTMHKRANYVARRWCAREVQMLNRCSDNL